MEQFFTFINDWLNSGIYTFFTDAAAYFVELTVVGYLKFINFIVPFAWGVAKTILQDLDLSSHINSAYSQFPSMTRDLLTALRVPEAVNFAITGFATKFVLRFIPGL